MDKKAVNIPYVGIAEVNDYEPTEQETKIIDEFEQQAEADITIIKHNANVNFRWNEGEIQRAKKIAAKLGMPYQTYIKSTLKQAMDRDEKRLAE